MQKQSVAVISEQGWTRKSVRRMYWKRFSDDTAKMLFEVEQPISEAGLKVLIIKQRGADPVLYVYTPDTGRARRMVGSGASNSVLGTDLTYEDALHFENFLNPELSRRRPDQTFEGAPVYVIETRPADDSSAYALIRTFIDQALCVPLRTEFFGHNGTLHKALVTHREDIEYIKEHPVARHSVMFNYKQQSRTEFTVTEVEIDTPLRDRLFTLAGIRKSH